MDVVNHDHNDRINNQTESNSGKTMQTEPPGDSSQEKVPGKILHSNSDVSKTNPQVKEVIPPGRSIDPRHLTPLQAQRCEGFLTTDECFVALKAMPKNKTPGLDGLPAEFYISFWDLFGHDLVDVLNSCFVTRTLSKTQRAGLITLLFKKDDPLEMGNWRPITLLCVDYKIMSKALANHLLSVIQFLISPDQTCGIPGRFIGDNIRLIHDIVEYANDNNLPGAILSLDQEKAFDRVDWGYMLRVLSTMGFGESFCSWVQLMYHGANSSVIINGFVSDAFPVSRGVRQGCLLPPLLYVLVAETLACAVRADQMITGFPIPLSRLS